MFLSSDGVMFLRDRSMLFFSITHGWFSHGSVNEYFSPDMYFSLIFNNDPRCVTGYLVAYNIIFLPWESYPEVINQHELESA